MLGEMDSESKKLKDDGNVSSSSSFHTDAAAVKTVLSDDVINMLRQSAYTQLPNGKLDLSRLYVVVLFFWFFNCFTFHI